MKNVLILSGSPRKNGNSDMLCDSFMKGVKEMGVIYGEIKDTQAMLKAYELGKGVLL